MSAPSAPSGSRWPAIILVTGAGVVSACQVGKAPTALAAVQSDLALDLATASWLLSAFAIVGAVAGAPIGLAVDRLGARRMAIGGLLLQGLACAAGVWATHAAALLATRVIEGIGFLGVVVAAPALIVALAPERDRQRALALWATFMPLGLTLVMLATPLLEILHWREFWALNAALLIAYAVLLAVAGGTRRAATGPTRSISENLRQAVKAPGPWLLGGLFATHAALFFAVFGFLPAILRDRLGVEAATAGVLSAVAVAISGAGNVVCGQLLARGIQPSSLLGTSYAVMALCALGIFTETLPGALALGLCMVFSFVGGVIPVVILDAAPRRAPAPELVGATLGFAMQGNNVGLMIGPAAAGAIAGAAGWPTVAVFTTMVAIIAGVITIALTRSAAGPARMRAVESLPRSTPWSR